MRDRAVALVGMACRLPDADDPETLWRNVLQRRVSFREIERWNHRIFLEAPPRDPHFTATRKAAFLDRVDRFAGPHFGIAPRRAESLDPQQRLSLEVVREALQDAALEGRPFDRRRTAVFLGASVSEYAQMGTMGGRVLQLGGGEFGDPGDARSLGNRVKPIRSYTLPGSLLSMCASSVAQAFDLRGPAFTVDAACASALTATVQAVTYLRGLPPRRGGDPAPVALAGGAYLQLLPDCTLGFSRIGALAAEECRPFDARSSGFLMGEGVVAVVLKRLRDAELDGDRIYAVIRGAAWNSDGEGESPMTPEADGQAEVLTAGFEDAGLDPARVEYVECHGTGTRAGDTAELEALARVLPTSGRPRLGSVKANIGHTMSVSGAAGLLRAALALHHGVLPPQAGFDEWHPELARFAERFEIATEPAPWPAPVRHATVSSFGFGGSNSFLVLESYANAAGPRAASHALCPSADTDDLLDDYLQALAERLPEDLSSVAWTLALGRTQKKRAAVVIARDPEEAARKLHALAGHETPPETWRGDGADVQQQAGQLLGRPFQPAGRPVTLPFVPLERQSYWVIAPS